MCLVAELGVGVLEDFLDILQMWFSYGCILFAVPEKVSCSVRFPVALCAQALVVLLIPAAASQSLARTDPAMMDSSVILSSLSLP